MRGDPPIRVIEQRVNRFKSSDRRERCRPPKFASEQDHSIGAAEYLPGRGEHAHFFEDSFRRQVESLANPFALERFEMEAALGEC